MKSLLFHSVRHDLKQVAIWKRSNLSLFHHKSPIFWCIYFISDLNGQIGSLGDLWFTSGFKLLLFEHQPASNLVIRRKQMDRLRVPFGSARRFNINRAGPPTPLGFGLAPPHFFAVAELY